MDPLSDLLELAEIRGTVFSRASLSAPWGVSTRGADGAAIFHVVTRGGAWVRLQGGDDLPLRAGDLVLLPHGDPHELRDSPEAPVCPLRSLPTDEEPGTLPRVRHGGGGAETEILCGSFRFGPAGARWLLPLLPPRLVVRGQQGPAAGFLDATLRLLEREVVDRGPGCDLLVGRLADVLLVQVLRTWAAQEPEAQRGWLRALGDPHLGRALAAAHAEPGRPWTAEDLARRAGLSRSSFFERFQAVMGEAPARWLTAWRMTRATELLRREPGLGLAEVAARVGYESEASFCRAFKRHQGTTAARWRQQAVSARTPSPGRGTT